MTVTHDCSCSAICPPPAKLTPNLQQYCPTGPKFPNYQFHENITVSCLNFTIPVAQKTDAARLSVCPSLALQIKCSLLQIRIRIFLRQRVHMFHFVLNKISGFLRGVPEDCNSAAPLSASDQFATQLAAVPNVPHHPVSSYTKCPLCSLHCTPGTVATLCKLPPCYSISMQFHCSPAPHTLLARNQPTADVNNFCSSVPTNCHPEKMTLLYISVSYL